MSNGDENQSIALTCVDQLHALVVCSDLLGEELRSCCVRVCNRFAYRLQVALHVSYVSASRATRVLSRFLDHVLVKALLIKKAAVYYFKTDDLCAFLKDVDRCGGHRTRKNATNVCMMSAGSSKEDDFVRFRVKDGRDDRNIREVTVTAQGWREGSFPE